MKIPIEKIIPDPNQPRKTFDEDAIRGLANSFKNYGIISPLKVRPHGDNKYMIIVGELRYRAAKQKGDKEVECIVQEATDEQAWEMQLIENLQRSDINPIELGESFLEGRQKYNLSRRELEPITGFKERTIREYEECAKNLTLNVKCYVKQGKLSFTDSIQVARITDSQRQVKFADYIMAEDMSGKAGNHVTRDAATLVNKYPERSITEIIVEVRTGKAKEKEEERDKKRVEAVKEVAGEKVSLETPEELLRAAEALKKQAKAKAEAAMTPEEKAQKVAQKAKEEAEKARIKAEVAEEKKRKKAEEDKAREERAEKKARNQLLKNSSFQQEVLDKIPKEVIRDRLRTEEERKTAKEYEEFREGADKTERKETISDYVTPFVDEIEECWKKLEEPLDWPEEVLTSTLCKQSLPRNLLVLIQKATKLIDKITGKLEGEPIRVELEASKEK